MDEIEHGLALIKGRWLTGGSAAEQVPTAWRQVVSADADPDLAAVALAGQAMQVGFRPTPAAALAPRPPLPHLALPSLPGAARPRFRRVMGMFKQMADQTASLLAFLEARGYAAHPADWMPRGGGDEVRELYAPWLDWLAEQSTDTDAEQLTADNWEDWPSGQRAAELRSLRRSDPVAALELVAAKAPGEKADQRLRLVQALTTCLSDADLPFLESLSADRSEKVRTLATTLAARLGRAAETGEMAGELADFLKLGTAGLLSRKPAVTPKPLKTTAQKTRRRELFGVVSLAGLAQALGMTEDALVEAWRPKGDGAATESFVHMVSETGSDAVQLACAQRLLEEGADMLSSVGPLARRLDGEARRGLAATIRDRDGATFAATVACAGDALGDMPYVAIAAAPGFRALISELKAFSKADDARHKMHEHEVLSGTFHLGLLADPPAAVALIDRFTELGLMAADPKLDMLHLNAALERRPQRD
ncbi:MAG: DUF5691 domain-containing protein [Hyphomicrobiales bacterium]